jgi:phosphate transport system substrate-binding protein
LSDGSRRRSPRRWQSLHIRPSGRAALCLVVGAVAAVVFGGAASAEALRVGGATGALGVMRLLADEFGKERAGIDFRFVTSLSSGGGIDAVAEGRIDLGVSSRPLAEAEAAKELDAVAYGTTAVALVTRSDNSVAGVTTAQLAAIYSGDVDHWPDGRRIRLVLNAPGDSNTRVLRQMSPDMDLAVTRALGRNGMIIEATDAAVAEAIERVPGGLGAVVLPMALTGRKPLHVLALDGIMPSGAAIADGRYGHRRTFFLVTRRDASAPVRQFAEFVLSERARPILDATGHAPPAANPAADD